jgi:dihydroorotase
MVRPQDAALSAGGCAHDGAVASRLGLPGIPAGRRNASNLAAHCCYAKPPACACMSSRSAALPVPNYCATPNGVACRLPPMSAFITCCWTNRPWRISTATATSIPPLRSRDDREALLVAAVDGTLDAVCSQHLPLGSSSKQAPFPATRPGIAGVETLLPLMLLLVEQGALTLHRAIELLTSRSGALPRPADRSS